MNIHTKAVALAGTPNMGGTGATGSAGAMDAPAPRQSRG